MKTYVSRSLRIAIGSLVRLSTAALASAVALMATAARAEAPQSPGRMQIVAAMNGVRGAVLACARGDTGTATVRMTFSGVTGHATSAQATGPLPDSVLRCVERAVLAATVPPFGVPTFTVSYPFRLP